MGIRFTLLIVVFPFQCPVFPHAPISLPPSCCTAGKTSFPITTICKPMYFHSNGMAHMSAPYSVSVLLASVVVLPCVFLVTARAVRGHKTHKANIHMYAHWHQGCLLSERSCQLELKARITEQDAVTQAHCSELLGLTMEGLLSCVSWLWAFLQDSFPFGFPLSVSLQSRVTTVTTVGMGCAGWLEQNGCWDEQARREFVNPHWTTLGWARHKSTIMPCWNKDQWTSVHLLSCASCGLWRSVGECWAEPQMDQTHSQMT